MLRSALVIPVVTLALLGATVNAHAAAWTGKSGATTCTGGPVAFDYNQPGNCVFSGAGGATFLGQFNTPAVVIDQTLCTTQATDAKDTICGHFGMDLNNVLGTITVAISFDPVNDLDLCVTTATATVVGTCSTSSAGTETVTFNVACADTRYEAQILPISFGFEVPTPIAPATYNGNVTASLTSCTPGGGLGNGNPGREPFDHHGKGGGQGENDDNHESEHISSDVEEKDSDHQKRGKVRYSKNGCDMRSTSINTIDWNDVTRTMVVSGFGTVNGIGSVPFVFTMTDNGPGAPATYTVDSTCSGRGHLKTGSFKYQNRRY
jgi:hypothetical protein